MELVGALTAWVLFIRRQILLPNLLALDLLVLHGLHLSLKLASTVLDVEDLAAFQSLFIAVDDVDNVDAERNPYDQHANYGHLNTD